MLQTEKWGVTPPPPGSGAVGQRAAHLGGLRRNGPGLALSAPLLQLHTHVDVHGHTRLVRRGITGDFFLLFRGFHI